MGDTLALLFMGFSAGVDVVNAKPGFQSSLSAFDDLQLTRNSSVAFDVGFQGK